jgi:hypothetical protein
MLLVIIVEFKGYFFIAVLGVHCGIYKSSYNISYLNLPAPSFSFISYPSFLE